MANITVPNGSTSYNLSSGDEIYVARDVVHTVSGDEAIEALALIQNTTAIIDGSVLSFSNAAIRYSNGANFGGHEVFVGPEGLLRSAHDTTNVGAVEFSNSSTNALYNLGSIFGGSGVLVISPVGLHLIENHGTINGLASGRGIWATGASATGQLTTIVNSGTISAGIGIEFDLTSGVVRNSGTIIGTSTDAIRVNQVGSVGIRVENSGQIEGAVLGGSLTDIVVNSGVINGLVNLGDGVDVYQAIEAGYGHGLVMGGAGDDRLYGADGHDSLSGGSDNDDLRGRNGHDELIGGDGNDTLRGGDGNDRIISGPERLPLNATDADLAWGGAGRDTLEGGADRDTLYGQGGDDVLDGGSGSDNLYGGSGNDLVLGQSGFDSLFGGLANDTLEGGPGSDILWGQGGEDSLSGGDQSDALYGGGLGDTLSGGSGFDLLNGGRGADMLDGGSGNDTLTGGRGDDELTGGIGADVFVFRWANGDDVITDFQNTFDLIDLTALDVALPDVMAAVSAVGASAVLLDLNALGASGTVLIDGVSLAGIGGGDFIL